MYRGVPDITSVSIPLKVEFRILIFLELFVIIYWILVLFFIEKEEGVILFIV